MAEIKAAQIKYHVNFPIEIFSTSCRLRQRILLFTQRVKQGNTNAHKSRDIESQSTLRLPFEAKTNRADSRSPDCLEFLLN